MLMNAHYRSLFVALASTRVSFLHALGLLQHVEAAVNDPSLA